MGNQQLDKAQPQNLFNGLKGVRDALRKHMKTYFECYLNNMNLILATFLDPRYKLNFFKHEPEDSKFHLKSISHSLVDAYQNILTSDSDTAVAENDLGGVTLEDHGADDGELDFHTWAFSQYVPTEDEQISNSPGSGLPVSQVIDHEIGKYCQTSMIPETESPVDWWRQNQIAFPCLASLAYKYLCSPPSSVESERLFSIGGNIYTPHRNRLSPDNGQKLMFLNYNLRLLDCSFEE